MSNIEHLEPGSVMEALRGGAAADKRRALDTILNQPAGLRLTLGWFRRVMGEEFAGIGGSVKDLLPIKRAKIHQTPAVEAQSLPVTKASDIGDLVISVYPEGTLWREDNQPAAMNSLNDDPEAVASAVFGEIPNSGISLGGKVHPLPIADADGAHRSNQALMPEHITTFDPTSPRS